MLGLYKRKIDVALITIVNNIIDLVDDEPKEKRVVKRARGRKWRNDRDEKGAYNNIVSDLFLHDEEGFRRFMRMNYEKFIELTEMITPIVSKMDTVMRKAICPKQRLALTLRFLVTGESFRSLEYQFRISRKAVSYIQKQPPRGVARKRCSENMQQIYRRKFTVKHLRWNLFSVKLKRGSNTSVFL